MKAIRKINNNVVICTDSKGREMIAMGKGLGFQKVPREISLKEVERTFYNIDEGYYKLIEELPEDILEFSAEITELARNELPYELSPNQAFILADHVMFTIERARKNIRVALPLTYEIRQKYPKEFQIGQYAVRRMSRKFRVKLPEEEAAAIALNLINGRITGNSDEEENVRNHNEEMLDEITFLIEKNLVFIIDRDSFNFTRFATHMEYLFDRIRAQKIFDGNNSEMYASFKEEYPAIFNCTEEIGNLFQEKWHVQLTQEEKLYLMIHINRIYTKRN